MNFSSRYTDVVIDVWLVCIAAGMPRAPVVGKVVLGQVKRVFAHEGLQVALPGYTGRVDITDISDHYTDSPLKKFCRAQFIRYCGYTHTHTPRMV